MNADDSHEMSIAGLAAQYSSACRVLYDAYLQRDDVVIPVVNTAVMAIELSLLTITSAFGSGPPSADGAKTLPRRPFDGIPVNVVDTLECAFAHWSGHQAGSLKQRLALYWPLLRGARRVTVSLAIDFPLEPLIDLVRFLEQWVHTIEQVQE